MTFDPTSVEVTCATLPKDHCVQVPWEYINVCRYNDQFCKNNHIHTHTTYIHTHTTYRISDHIVSFWTTFRRVSFWTTFRRDNKAKKEPKDSNLTPALKMFGQFVTNTWPYCQKSYVNMQGHPHGLSLRFIPHAHARQIYFGIREECRITLALWLGIMQGLVETCNKYLASCGINLVWDGQYELFVFPNIGNQKPCETFVFCVL